MWERRTSERDGSFWPTPTTAPEANNQGSHKISGPKSLGEAARLGSPLWPTPNTEGWRSDGELSLRARKVPTWEEFLALTNRSSKSKRNKWGSKLAWPTPMVQDSRMIDPESHKNGKRKSPCLGSLVNQSEGTINGKLNPTWVEWLMGYPLGWTVLEDWAMRWFQSRRGKRSKDSVESKSNGMD